MRAQVTLTMQGDEDFTSLAKICRDGNYGSCPLPDALTVPECPLHKKCSEVKATDWKRFMLKEAGIFYV